MHNINSFISAISMLVSLCGITSFRMFTPFFLYMLLIRYGGQVEWLAAGVANLQAMTPAWMNNNLVFVFLGLLAALEIAANWNTTLREFLTGTKFDECAKVVFAALISFGFLNVHEKASLQEVQNIMPDVQMAAALPLALVGAACCGALTAFLVQLRSVVVDFVNQIDPDNDLHLQTLFVGAEESMALFILIMAILMPILAFIITLLIIALGKLTQLTMRRVEESTNHLCPTCGKSISSLAENCPECGAAQTEVYSVGIFGLPGKKLIDLNNATQLREHRLKLLLMHRCSHCATRLHNSSCDKCHTALWNDGMAKEILRVLDRRAIVIGVIGLFLNAIPLIGFPCFVITFNALVMSRLRAFLNRLSGCMGKMLFTFLRVLFMLIIMLLSSIIPFVGLLIYLPYGIYYLYNRRAFLKATASNNDSQIASSGING